MITNNIPISLAVWLVSDNYDRDSRSNAFSVTSLLKPIKSIVLSSRSHEDSTSPDIYNLLPSRMGTAIHTAIEDAWSNPDNVKQALKVLGYPEKVISNIKVNPKNPSDCIPVYMEKRSEKFINGYYITGKFDFVLDGVLEDFKTTGVMTWIKQSNTDKYILQGSIYRWLNPDIITEDYMYIRYIFTDWSPTKAKQDSTYPQSRTISQKYELLSLQETEQYIHARLAAITQSLTADEHEIPSCTPDELWQRPTVYKYYKNPAKKTRSSGNFNNYHEAYQKFISDGSIGEIVTFPGEVVFCKYCNGINICNQAKQYINEGILNVD